MTDLLGLCSICGKPTAMHTCHLCGKLVCMQCYDTIHGVCIHCKQMG
jgi:hypothetical protein